MSQLPRLSGSIREQLAQDKQAYERGSRAVRTDKKTMARQLAAPQQTVQSSAAVLDGLMEIYERKGQVVMAIKEAAISTKEAAATLDIYA